VGMSRVLSQTCSVMQLLMLQERLSYSATQFALACGVVWGFGHVGFCGCKLATTCQSNWVPGLRAIMCWQLPLQLCRRLCIYFVMQQL
jgi:hypothetical protein